jgi:NADH-quinone oxidoreductase subunit C
MSSHTQALAGSITAALGDKAATLVDALGEVTLVVKAGDLIDVMTMLRDHSELRFEELMDLCGVDYSAFGEGTPAGDEQGARARDAEIRAPGGAGVAPATGRAGDGQRFAVVYHLLSLSKNWRLRVRTFAAEDDFPVVNSVVGIWASANWFEREAFDLFGIVFDGHPDLRRILTDYGFIGHPFRKDFPISGNVEMRYDPDQQRVIYQPVTIEPREITPRIVREEHYADSEGFRKG